MESAPKKIALIAFGGIIIAIVWYVFIPYVMQLSDATIAKRISVEALSSDRRPLEMILGTTTLRVTLAIDEGERERGLSGKLFIGEDEGLLLVFEKKGYPGIWMKGMYFPIDIAWLDKQFRVVHIERDVSPSTYPESFNSDVPAQYVLEMNAGFFEAHGIVLGDSLRLGEKESL